MTAAPIPRASREARKARGTFYTPAAVAGEIVEEVFAVWRSHRADVHDGATCWPRVLDPACGDGSFLLEAFRQLAADRWEKRGEAAWSQWLELARQHVFGVDVDEAAVHSARYRLAQEIANRATPSDPDARPALIAHLALQLQENVVVGDALLRPKSVLKGRSKWGSSRDGCAVLPARADSFCRRLLSQRFDAIVGNPPYVNIRQLSKSYPPQYKSYLGESYDCAHRAYDLYVLFIERAYELLEPQGICGFIVPNKIASLDYALPCRRLLLEKTTLCSITDISDRRLFRDAGVYPYIMVWKKEAASEEHRIEIRNSDSSSVDADEPEAGIVQSRLAAETGLTLSSQLDVEQRVATHALGDIVRIQCGTTGFAAQQMAKHLQDIPEGSCEGALPFIVSGCIRRYSIQDGNVRFMRKHFGRPVLPHDAPILTANKRELFQSPKIVVSGLSRSLHASWDARGRALGVQVYSLDRAQVNPFFLLGLLNARLMSYLFRLRFQAKRLGGDYLSINKGQLARLPIPICDDLSRGKTAAAIAEIAQELTRHSLAGSLTPKMLNRHSEEIDQLVFQLYEVKDSELQSRCFWQACDRTP